jgi:hypothetical protein
VKPVHPFPQLVARARKRRERRAIELLEERTPTDAEGLHRPLVNRIDALPNRGVEIGEREKGPMAQDGEHPALGDLHTDLRFRFVFRPRDSRGDDDRAIMLRELSVGAIDLGFVPVGQRDAALQIVRDPNGCTALEVLQHPHVRMDPGREVLATGGLGVDQSTGAEDADQELDGDLLAGGGIDQVRTWSTESACVRAFRPSACIKRPTRFPTDSRSLEQVFHARRLPQARTTPLMGGADELSGSCRSLVGADRSSPQAYSKKELRRERRRAAFTSLFRAAIATG